MRSATGVTVFAGMIGVTLFGLFLTPVFYVGLRKLSGRKLIQHGAAKRQLTCCPPPAKIDGLGQ
jgi:multidrug efflux pump